MLGLAHTLRFLGHDKLHRYQRDGGGHLRLRGQCCQQRGTKRLLERGLGDHTHAVVGRFHPAWDASEIERWVDLSQRKFPTRLYQESGREPPLNLQLRLGHRQTLNSDGVTLVNLPVCTVKIVSFNTGFDTKTVTLEIGEDKEKYKDPIRILVKHKGSPEIAK